LTVPGRYPCRLVYPTRVSQDATNVGDKANPK
jgi:hypothetical protein